MYSRYSLIPSHLFPFLKLLLKEAGEEEEQKKLILKALPTNRIIFAIIPISFTQMPLEMLS